MQILLEFLKNAIFDQSDKIKQASKQKEWYNASLKFKESKHQF
jgi:hypothetical protein